MANKAQQYRPTGQERLWLITSDDFSELAAAESEIDQPYELDNYCQKLEADYEESIISGACFLVDGVLVPPPELESELERRVLYGRIDGFDIHKDLDDQHWISAVIIDYHTEERNQVFVSSFPGYESSFTAVIEEKPADLDTSEWDEIAELYGSKNSVGFLGRTVVKFAFEQIDINTAERLQALEHVLDKKYGITVGDFITVIGRHAHHGTGRPMVDSPIASEGSHNGKYIGISLLEVRSSSRYRKYENLPCLAIELQDGSILQQPLHSLYQLELATD